MRARVDGPPGSALLSRGTVLKGVYYIESPIARGGGGEIYLAWDSRLQREVAIKVPLAVLDADQRSLRRFREAARAVARVRHTNVVRVIATGQHGSLPFLVMEHVPGGTVAGLIRETSRRGEHLRLDTVSHLLDQAAQGLTALQRCGLFHGDVKPSNLLLAPDHHLALADFDRVGSTADLAAAQPPLPSGTPLYIAPELICGADVRPDRRYLCDLYSLGASVFEMLTGSPPVFGASIHEILRAHLFEPAPRVSACRPDLPPELDAILGRALAKRPEERFQSYRDFSFELARVTRRALARVRPRAARPVPSRRVEPPKPRPIPLPRLAPASRQMALLPAM